MKFLITLLALSNTLAFATQTKNKLNCSFRHFKDNKVIDQLTLNKEFNYYDLNDVKISSKNKRFTVVLYASYLPEATVRAKVYDHKMKTTTYFPEINERQIEINDGLVYEDKPSQIPKRAESLMGSCHVTEE